MPLTPERHGVPRGAAEGGNAHGGTEIRALWFSVHAVVSVVSCENVGHCRGGRTVDSTEGLWYIQHNLWRNCFSAGR